MVIEREGATPLIPMLPIGHEPEVVCTLKSSPFFFVKLSRCVLNSAPSHADRWGNRGITPHILNLGTRWRWVVIFTLRPLYLRGKNPGALWIGGWVGPRAGLAVVMKRKIMAFRDSNPGRPALNLVIILTRREKSTTRIDIIRYYFHQAMETGRFQCIICTFYVHKHVLGILSFVRSRIYAQKYLIDLVEM
jgi:hypothetical protein